MTETGKLVYTERAFEQDAGQAMAGDIVRGLIELITNSDDAYGDAEGPIEIFIDRPSQAGRPTIVSVIDTAKGLDPDEMKRAFSVLGGQFSGFAEGQSVRGLFGRGAKDVAWFGAATFRSIKNGVCSSMQLERDGTWRLDSHPATPQDYEHTRIAPSKNGLNASIVVEPSIAQIPTIPKLVSKLGSHTQLRRIVSQRDVTVRQWKDGIHERTIPVIWEVPPQDLILEETFAVPGYGSCSFLLYQLMTRVDGPVNEYSIHGIEVYGQRASYMNTFFGMTGFGVGLLRGIIQADAIDDLIRTYDLDTNDPVHNPTRLVRRDRDGLDEGHPFFRLLQREVIQRVQPVLDGLEPSVSEAGGSGLRTDLGRAAKLIEDLLREDLDEAPEQSIGGLLPTKRHPLALIPPSIRGRIGDDRTISVLIDGELANSSKLRAGISNDFTEILSPLSTPIVHPEYANTLISQIRISLKSLGASRLVVSIGDEEPVTATCEVVVHNDPEVPDSPPSTLEWKNTSMSVTVGRERSVTLRAPAESSPDGTLAAVVSLEGDTVELLDPTLTLKLSREGWLSGRVRVKGLKPGPSATLTARSPNDEAVGRIRSTLPNAVTGLNFEIKVVPLEQGVTRGVIESGDTGMVLRIFAKHPGLAPYFGQLRDDDSFIGEQRTEARAALAEAAASVLADFMCRRERERDPSSYADLDMYQSQRARFVARYIRRLIEGLRV